MRRFFWIFWMLLLCAGTAFAADFGGAIGSIGGKLIEWIGGQAIGAITAGVLVIISRRWAKKYDTVARTLKEGGEAMTQMGTAMISQDREEIKKIVPAVRDVFDVYRETPDRFKDPAGTLAPGMDTVIR